MALIAFYTTQLTIILNVNTDVAVKEATAVATGDPAAALPAATTAARRTARATDQASLEGTYTFNLSQCKLFTLLYN